MGASVLQRLRNRAKANREDVGLTLVRYACERFLYRLSQSAHRDHFVLKGATLFAVWQDKPYRATGDLDFLGMSDSTPDAMRRVVEEIAAVACESDGVTFLLDTLTVEVRTEGRAYSGLHVEIGAALCHRPSPRRDRHRLRRSRDARSTGRARADAAARSACADPARLSTRNGHRREVPGGGDAGHWEWGNGTPCVTFFPYGIVLVCWT